jgi:hypothetical protein
MGNATSDDIKKRWEEKRMTKHEERVQLFYEDQK